VPYEISLPPPALVRTWPGSNGSIMLCCAAMRRIHLSLFIDICSRFSCEG